MAAAMLLAGCVPAEAAGAATARARHEVSGQVSGAAGPRPGDAGPGGDLRGVARDRFREAALELGKRYERGDGVPVDFQRAADMYRRAATDTPAATAVYSPPVRPGDAGRVLRIDNPNPGQGLAEAKFRLGLLYLAGQGVRLDADKGEGLIRAAARQGFSDALRYFGGRPPH